MANVNITHIIYVKNHYKHFLDLGEKIELHVKKCVYTFIIMTLTPNLSILLKNVFIDDIYLPLIWLKLLYYKHVLNLLPQNQPARPESGESCFVSVELNLILPQRF